MKTEITKVKKYFDDKYEALGLMVQMLENTATLEFRLIEFEEQPTAIGHGQDGDTHCIARLEDEIARLQRTKSDMSTENDISKNIVLQNVPDATGEDVKEAVNNVLKKGLKLHNIKIERPERTNSYTNSKPGVIVATCGTDRDKAEVMRAKSTLAGIEQYSDVIIHHDKTKQDKILPAAIRIYGSLSNSLRDDPCWPSGLMLGCNINNCNTTETQTNQTILCPLF